jgi:hypothetical protein
VTHPTGEEQRAEAALAAHDHAEAGGDDGYFDPHTGLFVMTTAYHLRRGACCDSGCRHCPYT